MKRLLFIGLAFALLFTLAACRNEQIPTNEPGSSGASKPTSDKPPVLQIQDGTGQTADALHGTYSWMYDRGDGIWMGVEADSMHPLQMQEYLKPFAAAGDTVELVFAVPPQDITIRCWRDTMWEATDAVGEVAELDGYTLKLQAGGYIYEVCATWTGENLAAYGTAHYCFYAIRSDHGHEPAQNAQTVQDPYSGYCGNTMTTIILNGKEFSFDGSDSVYLTDTLLNLAYDPDKLCDCMSEFTVKTEFGGPYGVNLSQGYARYDGAQADLTKEQIEAIRVILDRQT